jgi:hypothetical protein
MQSFGYFGISLALISEQQNPGTVELASRVLAAFDEIQQVCTFSSVKSTM